MRGRIYIATFGRLCRQQVSYYFLLISARLNLSGGRGGQADRLPDVPKKPQGTAIDKYFFRGEEHFGHLEHDIADFDPNGSCMKLRARLQLQLATATRPRNECIFYENLVGWVGLGYYRPFGPYVLADYIP
jgi:hypothetical protein